MAKGTKSVGTGPAAPLSVGLHDPGMTPLLRAGLGGLAASVRALRLEQDPVAEWLGCGRVEVPLGPGVVTIESDRVTLSWGDQSPAETLKALFVSSFRLRSPGVIDLPGTYEVTRPRGREEAALFATEQVSLKRTFLQHGKMTPKAGKLQTRSAEIDGVMMPFVVQPFSSYVQQRVWEEIADALPNKPIRLAGWAYPGAAQRHTKFAETAADYAPAHALCACFALVGCVSFLGPRGAGVLVIPEPDDLLRFAQIRARLGPQSVREVFVSGHADAVLAVESVLRMQAQSEAHRGRGVRAVSGVLLRATPWDSKQKYRIRTVHPSHVDDASLDLYDMAARTLPTELRVPKGEAGGAEDEGGGFFGVPSELRAFVTENLALGRAWYAGFAAAKTDDLKDPRWLHRYYSSNDKHGALRAEDRKGLIAMLEHLDRAETALVRSVHVALRQRFGAISEECAGNDVLMKKRFSSERDRWRFAFAGAKTPEQIRSALADLWSRAGSNSELAAKWQDVLPLLRPEHWQAARDLALIALVSYQSERAAATSSSESAD